MNKFMTTIVIPTIGRRYLYNAVKSAQAQIGGMVQEIIISIDAKYKDANLNLPPQSDNIRYRVVYGEIPGVSGTLNMAIASSKTRLISWLSDDDEYTQIKILHQINAIRKYAEQHPELYLDLDKLFVIGSFSIKTLENGNITTHNPSWLINRFSYELGYFSLAYGMISGCTALFSKKLWERVGGFPDEFRTTQDYILWKRILDKTPTFIYTENAGIITNVHDEMESKSLSHIHKIEKETLLGFIYSGYMAQFQNHDLSIADQRQLYYTAPNEKQLFGPYFSNDNHAIKSLAALEVELNKLCLLFIQQTPASEIDYSNVADKTHLIADVLRQNLYEKVGDAGTEYKDSELGYFVDSYWLANGNITKICGISSSHFSLSATRKEDLLYEAISNYRYVALYNISNEADNNTFELFLNEIKAFDRSNELLPFHITINAVENYKFSDNYRLFVRNPFLANSASLK